ncbi:MAG TPA: TlpA family protein disulfide reductase [Lutibacter sp.]|nr:TlpA family protein disulfide reductase [Lutibacter sp.]
MMKKLLFITLVLSFTFGNAQGKKKLWAKSFINKKTPELIVETWLTDEPSTQGKFVLIDFWATWCAPCRKIIPDLNNLHQQFNTDLVVIGLSDETETKLRAFNAKIDYHQATDTKKRTKNTFKVKGIPHTVLIDPDGIVRWEGYPLLPGFELTEEIVNKIITDYNSKK